MGVWWVPRPVLLMGRPRSRSSGLAHEAPKHWSKHWLLGRFPWEPNFGFCRVDPVSSCEGFFWHISSPSSPTAIELTDSYPALFLLFSLFWTGSMFYSNSSWRIFFQCIGKPSERVFDFELPQHIRKISVQTYTLSFSWPEVAGYAHEFQLSKEKKEYKSIYMNSHKANFAYRCVFWAAR